MHAAVQVALQEGLQAKQKLDICLCVRPLLSRASMLDEADLALCR